MTAQVPKAMTALANSAAGRFTFFFIRSSKLAEQVLGCRYFELPRRFDVHCFRDTVVDDDGEALAPCSHAETACVELEAQRARIVAIPVGEHEHLVPHV